MKKLAYGIILLFTLGTAFTGCRDQKTAGEKVEDAMDDTGDAIEDAADDVEDALN